MNLLILKGFNNYFNRKIKKYIELQDYIDNSMKYYDFKNIDFNPNDGVSTSQVIGSENQKEIGGPEPEPLKWETEGSPDYLIAYTQETFDETVITTIHSRWFVLESVRTRYGQYQLKLRRDTISDNFESLLSCPAFIKKGTVSDDNPLIVNDEGVRVNQIKTSETLLKDGSNSAWLVGYLEKQTSPTGITVQVPVDKPGYITLEDIAEETGVDIDVLSSILTDDKDNQVRFINDNIEVVGWLNYAEGTSLEVKVVAGSKNFLQSLSYSSSKTEYHSRYQDCFAKGVGPYPENHTFWKEALNPTTIKDNWETLTHHPFLTRAVYNKLLELQQNKTLIYKNGLYYQVKIGTSTVQNTGETYFDGSESAIFKTPCDNYCERINTFTGNNIMERLSGGKVFINYNELTANIYLSDDISDVNVSKLNINMASTRNPLYTQPYDMFAIPANDIIASKGSEEFEMVGSYGLNSAIAIIEKLTQAKVYDLQLLPYCPIQEMLNNNKLYLDTFEEGFDYDWIDYTGDYLDYKDLTQTSNNWLSSAMNEYSITFNAQSDLPPASIDSWGYEYITSRSIIDETKSQSAAVSGTNFTVQLKTLSMSVVPLESVQMTIWWKEKKTGTVHRQIIIYPKNNSFSVNLDYNLTLKESMKIDSQTDLYRLVSPNYQGSFDFNVAKNGGAVNGFIADCTYKPYTPYIKVSPNFAWLYGTNYGDARGLICGGDFSIGFYTDRWQEYQLQNKNYQNIFNREIQNLDINQGIQRINNYTTGALNIGRDTITGAVVGGISTGNPYGAIAGAVVSGVGSAVGYGVDNNLMERSLQEQRRFAVDKFKMQLENIQALPYTLTKVGAFNINSKVWPFLEYYTCSEQEKEALKMKIQYEGMTVGIVDILGNYMSNGYLQADLIRNDTIVDDTHLLDDIYIELTKGVYM